MRLRLLALLTLTATVACLAAGAGTASAAPPCTAAAAKRAVVKTAFARHIRKSFGRGFFEGQSVLKVFHLSHRLCYDLTGDRKKEMVVGLTCCGGSADPWAIFTPSGRSWRLAFDRVNTDNAGLDVGIYDPFSDGTAKRAVEEKIPVGGGRKPRSYQYFYTVFVGGRFVYDVQ